MRPVAVGTKEVAAEKWAISANDNDELTAVSFAFTYKDNDTDRTLQIVNVALKNPIDLDDIVSGKATMTGNSATTNKTTVFTFDAKKVAEKQNLANALYAAHDETSDLMLYSHYAAGMTKNGYDILVEKDNQYIIKTLEVNRGDNSDSTIIANLADESKVSNKETLQTYTLNGSNIYSSAYTLESFGGSATTPEQPEPETPVTNAEIITVLEENCKDALLEECFVGIPMNKANITNENWYLTEDTDGKITKAEYTLNYQYSNTIVFFAIGKVSFNTPISINDLKDGKTENATYASVYLFNFNPTIQETRAELTNAICDTVLGENVTATRYIVEGRTDLGLGEPSRLFTVIQVIDGKIQETKVNIIGTSDADYIDNITNSDNYSVEKNDTYEISGTLLTAED